MDNPRITPSEQLRCSHCKRLLPITSSASSGGGVVPCSNCRKVFYCSLAHMKSHCAKHEKTGCFPGSVQYNPECGRFWVASRDIAMDEVIFIDEAIVLAPHVPFVSQQAHLYPTCLGCCRGTNTSYRCSRCGWPMCSKKCERMPCHFMNECKIFKKNKIQQSCRPQFYFFIQFLRALLLREQNPPAFAELMDLEPHLQERKQVKEEVFMLKSFYKFLTEDCNLWDYEFELVDHIVGVNRVNCYSADALIFGRKRFCTALFPKLSLINHNCKPNTRTILREKDKSEAFGLYMELRASVDIRQGEEISQQYITSTKGSLARQVNLSEDWYFTCECDRCTDPTEFNTYFQALKCGDCDEGFLLPITPTKIHSLWQCGVINSVTQGFEIERGCGNLRSGDNVRSFIESVEKQIKLIEHNPKELEKLHKELVSYSLHPNHYLAINLKFGVVDSIVKKLNYYSTATQNDSLLGYVADADILKGVEYAKGILNVTRVICPGRSYCVGVILYFLVSCLAELQQRQIHCKGCDDDCIRSFVREAWAILSVESDGSSYSEMVESLEERSLVMNMGKLSL